MRVRSRREHVFNQAFNQRQSQNAAPWLPPPPHGAVRQQSLRRRPPRSSRAWLPPPRPWRRRRWPSSRAWSPPSPNDYVVCVFAVNPHTKKSRASQPASSRSRNLSISHHTMASCAPSALPGSRPGTCAPSTTGPWQPPAHSTAAAWGSRLRRRNPRHRPRPVRE